MSMTAVLLSGETNKMSRSDGNGCVSPTKVTWTELTKPPNPLTDTTEGYGLATPDWRNPGGFGPSGIEIRLVFAKASVWFTVSLKLAVDFAPVLSLATIVIVAVPV